MTTTTPTIASVREALLQGRADLDDAPDLIAQASDKLDVANRE
jgi:hypothetical protein